MQNANFDDLLARSGLSRAELARRLRVHPATVSRWGEEVPGYALAYLELYVSIRESL